jgi:CRP/FNR family cyclic AMP-dependent transcriptional regulator
MDDPILTIEEREAINSGRWFSSLSPSLRHDILRCAYVKRFKDGGLIAARGDPPEEWIACARGAVRVSSTSISGKQITLTYVEPGIWFGDVAIFDGDRRTHDAYAHGDTTILCVAKADFKKILAAHTEFYEAMLRLHARRIRQLYGLVEDLNTLPLRARLAKQLVHLVRSYGIPSLSDGSEDAHRPATGAGRTGATAGCIAPAGQPGTQGHGARGCHPHRAGRPGGARPPGADAHQPTPEPDNCCTPFSCACGAATTPSQYDYP